MFLKRKVIFKVLINYLLIYKLEVSLTRLKSPSILYHAVGGIKGPVVERNSAVKIEKYGADPIVIPIVLKMADFDHKVREFFL